jgi:hypothetical protein
VAAILAGAGARLVAVNDADGAIHAPEGIDVAALHAHVHEDPQNLRRTVAGFPGAEPITKRDFWAVDAEIAIPAALGNEINFGGYYAGRRNRYEGRLVWKPSEHVGISAIEDYNAVRLPQGDFNLSLVSGRVDWNASVRLLSSVIVQSDNVERLTSVQMILRWLIDPATDFFAVYSRQTGAGFERPGTRVTVKFRRTFDL